MVALSNRGWGWQQLYCLWGDEPLWTSIWPLCNRLIKENQQVYNIYILFIIHKKLKYPDCVFVLIKIETWNMYRHMVEHIKAYDHAPAIFTTVQWSHYLSAVVTAVRMWRESSGEFQLCSGCPPDNMWYQCALLLLCNLTLPPHRLNHWRFSFRKLYSI